MTNKLEEIENEPTLQQLREIRASYVKKILDDSDLDKLGNSPCIDCEQCNWRMQKNGIVNAYCRLHFEVVYPQVNEHEIIAKCLEHDLAE